jgi:mono/diheme cytochrome c family protein
VGAAAEGARFQEPYDEIGRCLLDRYPTRSRALDRELRRLIGCLRPAGAESVLADRLNEEHLPRVARIHLAYAMRGSRDTLGREEREAVLAFFAQIEEEGWSGGASFRGYLRLIGSDLIERFPEEARDSARARLSGLIEGRTPTDRPYRRPGYEQVFSAEELEELLVLDPTSYEGDAERGKEAFRKAFCASCHRAGSVGTGGAGPDLTTVGSRMDREDLVEAILYPDRAVSSRWASGASGESPMPTGLIHNLNRQEMVDLLLFLEGRTGNSDGP